MLATASQCQNIRSRDAGMACRRAQTSPRTPQTPLLYVSKHSRAFSRGITVLLRALFRYDNAMLQVVFFDLGQSACSASAVQFNKSKLKVSGVCAACPWVKITVIVSVQC